jgi:hypothetical protein
MNTVEKYAAKDDIVYFVKLSNSEFDEDKIDDRLLKLANGKVDSWIIEHGVSPRNISDQLNLLWSATICIALELLCYAGDVLWSTGDVAIQKLNKVTYGFQRWQPMFFFATGASDPFKGLLPHETYRMMAYAYVEAFCRDDFFLTYGAIYPIPRISRDVTSRGWGHETPYELVEAADLASLGDESTLESYYEPTFEEWDD